MKELEHCVICPRACGVNRLAGEKGYCRTGVGYPVASICLHRGEEPVISGHHGICNIFFSHCNLQCLYCQNYQISRNRGYGITEMSLEYVVSDVIRCLENGAEAVGFVTPSHVIPQVREIIRSLHASGRHPVTVYNSNGYDSLHSLKSLEGLVDVYLPDMKYIDPLLSAEYSEAADYPETAKMAILEMYRQKGNTLVVSESGQALNGMIIRHLVLPGHADDSIAILNWIASELSPSVHVSLMSQYCPTSCIAGHPVLSRQITAREYEQVTETMDKLGFHNGWVQELESHRIYNPDFSRDDPFE